jgi:leader peptidase (prepilin peptidase)/N-methyltransferase
MLLAAFLFGLLIGSFLNVCIYRLPRDLSVVRPSRSYCPHCGATIAWYDNVPLLSYVLLQGRCRSCRGRISARYPAVELLTGILFAAAVAEHGPSAAAAKTCLAAALLIGLIFADLEEFILPDEFTLGGLAAALVLAWFVPVEDETASALVWLLGAPVPLVARSVVEAAAGAALPAALLWAGGVLYQKIRGREGMGFGDVKMMAMMGAFFGLRGALLAMIVGSVLGSVTGLLYIKLTGKDAATTHLPFGTFLGIGGLVFLYWGKPLAAWYGGLY